MDKILPVYKPSHLYWRDKNNRMPECISDLSNEIYSLSKIYLPSRLQLNPGCGGKFPGCSTYDLIRIFKRETEFKGKIGHGGTLDPFACGVVLLLLGQATKKFEEIKSWEKVYVAGVKLGAKSSTGDIEGEIKSKIDAKEPTKKEIGEILKSFLGEQEQKIPAFSAAKFKGKKFYEIAREKGIVPPRFKIIKIKKIELLNFNYPFLIIRVSSSGGTYIRQLAEDIGEKLKCGGFLYFLEREKVGEYEIKDCVSTEEFKNLNLKN
jgi:tRNA pseudouridine55 synthase